MVSLDTYTNNNSVSGPYGNCSVIPSLTDELVLVGGGVGVTPMMSAFTDYLYKDELHGGDSVPTQPDDKVCARWTYLLTCLLTSQYLSFARDCMLYSVFDHFKHATALLVKTTSKPVCSTGLIMSTFLRASKSYRYLWLYNHAVVVLVLDALLYQKLIVVHAVVASCLPIICVHKHMHTLYNSTLVYAMRCVWSCYEQLRSVQLVWAVHNWQDTLCFEDTLQMLQRHQSRATSATTNATTLTTTAGDGTEDASRMNNNVRIALSATIYITGGDASGSNDWLGELPLCVTAVLKQVNAESKNATSAILREHCVCKPCATLTDHLSCSAV
jgi:hypothetical protein